MKQIDVTVAQKVANLLNRYITFRKGEVPDGWEKLFADGRQHVEYQLNDLLKINLYKDSKLAKLIYEQFEEAEKQFISNFLRPGDVFFDIGANIGLHSLYAAEALKDSGAIYAFEPTPVTFNRLRENVTLNHFQSMANTYNMGLSNKKDKLNFHISNSGYDAWNSFANLQHVPLETSIQASVLRFDEFVTEHAVNYRQIALIKVDVEGWELPVLEGMGDFLEQEDFKTCFMIEFTEENVFRAGYSCRDLYNFMTDKGYEWFVYDTASNRLVPSPMKAYYPYENLIAVKKTQLQPIRNRIAIAP
ncbi:FkbM family methyltransferase [Mucilaginibacter corticis]|uniref:FkbM family methyltransferase n=1 Tax=Mucilaginibacter corticis TaxID=2597670 RepID=A0A556M7U0_9SPHI|nr:FkbM family methyltransferase [Mucilaginibacter corticis]TSJ35959.1 FkbM family methyltransferase [Mucilaginibacter corticis]